MSDGHNRAAALLVTSQLLAAGTAFLVNILASRVMAPEYRGELALALQVCYVVTVVVLLGVERPYMATQHGRFGQQFIQFVSLLRPSLTAVVVIGAIALVFAAVWSSGILVMIFAVVAYIALNALTWGVRVAYVTSREWKPFVINSMLAQSIILSGALAFASQGIDRADVWMLIYVISGIVPLVTLCAAIWRSRERMSLPRGEARALRQRGLRLLPAAFGNTAMLRSDRLLLPLLSSSAELGLYVVVATVMEMAVWPTQQWVDASLRRWSTNAYRSRPIWSLLFQAALVVTAFSTILGVVCYFAVTLLLPPDYHRALIVIVPLAISSTIYAWTRVQQGLLISRGASGRVSVVEATGMGVSILLYVALIPPFGMVGAAIGSIIGYFVCALVGGWYLWKDARVE